MINIPRTKLKPMPAEATDPIEQIYAMLRAKGPTELLQMFDRAMAEGRIADAMVIVRAGRSLRPFPVVFPIWRASRGN